MRLQAVARSFNNTPCYDAYSGVLAFNAQLGLYDDTKRDSETAERRILSVDTSAEIPARRVVEAAGTRFIVGHGNPDTFRGSIVRVGYVAHEATHLTTIQTLQQFVLNTAGVSAWAGRAWIKNLGYSEQGSELNSFHHIHFSVTESLALSSILTFDGEFYLVRLMNKGAAGTLTAYCDKMPEPVVETASLGVGAYDPLIDTHSAVATPVRAIRIRWQSLFDYNVLKAPTFGPDDLQIALSKTAAVAPVGEKITMSDGTWMIASADDYQGVWLCRGVRHA